MAVLRCGSGEQRAVLQNGLDVHVNRELASGKNRAAEPSGLDESRNRLFPKPVARLEETRSSLGEGFKDERSRHDRISREMLGEIVLAERDPPRRLNTFGFLNENDSVEQQETHVLRSRVGWTVMRTGLPSQTTAPSSLTPENDRVKNSGVRPFSCSLVPAARARSSGGSL